MGWMILGVVLASATLFILAFVAFIVWAVQNHRYEVEHGLTHRKVIPFTNIVPRKGGWWDNHITREPGLIRW